MLQEDIQAMLSSIDKSLHGAETGELSKVELREALEAFFLVGQPGGKTLNRMEEIMQASPTMISPLPFGHCPKRIGCILYSTGIGPLMALTEVSRSACSMLCLGLLLQAL